MKIVLAAFVLSAVVASPAAARPAFVVPAAQDVDALVALLLPEDAMLKLGARAFEHGMDQEVAKDPVLKAQYGKYPGLRPAVTAALSVELAKVMRAALPSLRQDIRGIVVAELTPQEISDTLTFFSSPTGQKVRAQVYATMGDTPGQNPDQMKAAAMEAVMASMQPEDYPALMAFGASTAAQKMQTVNPRIAAASEAWSARMVEANGERLRTLGKQATERYLAEHR